MYSFYSPYKNNNNSSQEHLDKLNCIIATPMYLHHDDEELFIENDENDKDLMTLDNILTPSFPESEIEEYSRLTTLEGNSAWEKTVVCSSNASTASPSLNISFSDSSSNYYSRISDTSFVCDGSYSQLRIEDIVLTRINTFSPKKKRFIPNNEQDSRLTVGTNGDSRKKAIEARSAKLRKLKEEKQLLKIKQKKKKVTFKDLQKKKKKKLMKKRGRKKKEPEVYSCNICKKIFTAKNGVVVHMRIHTGEKPFPCRKCGRRFRQKGHLKHHATVVCSRKKLKKLKKLKHAKKSKK